MRLSNLHRGFQGQSFDLHRGFQGQSFDLHIEFHPNFWQVIVTSMNIDIVSCLIICICLFWSLCVVWLFLPCRYMIPICCESEMMGSSTNWGEFIFPFFVFIFVSLLYIFYFICLSFKCVKNRNRKVCWLLRNSLLFHGIPFEPQKVLMMAFG